MKTKKVFAVFLSTFLKQHKSVAYGYNFGNESGLKKINNKRCVWNFCDGKFHNHIKMNFY